MIGDPEIVNARLFRSAGPIPISTRVDCGPMLRRMIDVRSGAIVAPSDRIVERAAGRSVTRI